MDVQKEFFLLSKKQQYILIACAVGIIGCFLPWVNYPMMGSANGLAMNGKYVLITLGVIVFSLLNRDRQEPLEDTLQNRITALAGVGAALGLYHLFFDQLKSDLLIVTYSASHGLGLYLAIAATLAIVGITMNMEEEPKHY